MRSVFILSIQLIQQDLFLKASRSLKDFEEGSVNGEMNDWMAGEKPLFLSM